jgi:hypothetical protein
MVICLQHKGIALPWAKWLKKVFPLQPFIPRTLAEACPKNECSLIFFKAQPIRLNKNFPDVDLAPLT